MFLRSEKT